VVVPAHDPWLGVVETNVVPLGIVPPTVAAAASLGPMFVTVIA
jgi:hypothetical protein